MPSASLRPSASRMCWAARGSDEPLGGWNETRRWRIQLILSATPGQRLERLENAIELAYRSGALPKRREPHG